MNNLLEFIAVVSTGVLPSIVGFLLIANRPDYLQHLSPTERLASRWVGAISPIAVTLFVSINQPDGLASIGLYPRHSTLNQNAITTGIFALGCLLCLWIIVFRIFKLNIKQEIDPSQPHVAETMGYRNAWERLAYLSVLPFDVMAEEMVYRGYLVLLLGTRTGIYVPWVILSVILSIVVHLYQGMKLVNIVSHLAFAGLFVGLTVTTQNLAAAIGPHLVYNFIYKVRIWDQEKRKEDQQPVRPFNRRKKLAYSVFVAINALMFLYVYFSFVAENA